MELYEQAGSMFATEDSSSEASKCQLKVRRGAPSLPGCSQSVSRQSSSRITAWCSVALEADEAPIP